MFARAKRTSLLWSFINYLPIRFCSTGPRALHENLQVFEKGKREIESEKGESERERELEVDAK